MKAYISSGGSKEWEADGRLFPQMDKKRTLWQLC